MLFLIIDRGQSYFPSNKDMHHGHFLKFDKQDRDPHLPEPLIPNLCENECNVVRTPHLSHDIPRHTEPQNMKDDLLGFCKVNRPKKTSKL